MHTTLTVTGQVTLPRQIPDESGLQPGQQLDFLMHEAGDVVPQHAPQDPTPMPDRFEAVRGRADVAWRTRDLMNLLRGG